MRDVKISSVIQKCSGYDSAGRTTSVVSGAGTTTLAYDYEGRISQITYPSTATNTFTYNGLDTRVGKVDSAGTSTYKRDGAGVTAPVLNDGAATYTPGISERRSSTTTFLHSGLKNADSQTGTSQTIGATKQYDAFGNVLSSTGTWKGPFGYAGSFGYQEDTDSSLKLLGHRYYDASIGRFLTRDRIKDGRNWYVYCRSNPTDKVDAEGLKPKLIIIKGASKNSKGKSDIGPAMANVIEDYKREFGDKYDIDIVEGKTDKDFVNALLVADAAILIGHGIDGKVSSQTPGLPFTDRSLDQVRRGRRGKKNLKFVHLVSCEGLEVKSMNEKWQDVSDSTAGWGGKCDIGRYQHGFVGFEKRLGGN